MASKSVDDWFTNARRRSGWMKFYSAHAERDKDRVAKIVTDCEQPAWAEVQVDEAARADFEKVKEYFEDKDKEIQDDVRLVVEGLSRMPSSSVGAGNAPFSPSKSFLASVPESREEAAVNYLSPAPTRVVSGSSMGSNQRNVSSSSIISYEDPHSASPTLPRSNSPHPLFHYPSPPIPYEARLSPSFSLPLGDIPVNSADPFLTDLTQSLASQNYVDYSHFDPSPFFSTIGEQPYAIPTGDLWGRVGLGAGVPGY
ncbi:hypothetical protein P7C70_g3641, partial [Phenoliferia sp. Uapishka_3]